MKLHLQNQLASVLTDLSQSVRRSQDSVTPFLLAMDLAQVAGKTKGLVTLGFARELVAATRSLLTDRTAAAVYEFWSDGRKEVASLEELRAFVGLLGDLVTSTRHLGDNVKVDLKVGAVSLADL